MSKIAIRTLTFSDLQSVAALEAQVYPPSLQLGLADFQDDFERHQVNVSVGAFLGERLVGYLISYGDENRQLYVSDFVCQNPKALLPMLNAFRQACILREIHAEFRRESYELMQHFAKRFPGALKIRCEQTLPGYYGIEDGYHMILELGDIAA